MENIYVKYTQMKICICVYIEAELKRLVVEYSRFDPILSKTLAKINVPRI